MIAVCAFEINVTRMTCVITYVTNHNMLLSFQTVHLAFQVLTVAFLFWHLVNFTKVNI